MRWIVCTACAQRKEPAGTREILARSPEGEPAEFQRLIYGIAKSPQLSQRRVVITRQAITETHQMDISYYNCDSCNLIIHPGQLCACWSVWTDEQEPTAAWESEYIEAL